MIDPFVEQQVHFKIREVAVELGVPILRMNGGFDHVHIVHGLPRTLSIAKFIQEIKRKSSRHIREAGNKYAVFGWQEGYGSFSCDPHDLTGLFNYVDRQKEHHYGDAYGEMVRMTFDEELAKLLARYDAGDDV